MIKTLKDYEKIERYDLIKRAFDHDSDEHFGSIFDNIIQLTNNHITYSNVVEHPFYNRIKILVNAARINEYTDDDYYEEAFNELLIISKMLFGEEIRKKTLETMEIENSIEKLTKQLTKQVLKAAEENENGKS